MTVQQNIPALRFSEFDGEWIETIVGEFAPLQRGFDLPVATIEEGDYPVVFSNGILKHHNEFKVKGPGIVTGRSGTIGKVTYVKKDFWPHNTSLWVTNMKGNLPLFVYYFYIHFDLSRFSSGSGVPTLNRNDVHSQLVFSPKFEEQQKIATFLTAVDEKIQQLTRKKALLEQYKQGVMQQIFSREIRFKPDGGGEFGEWEEVNFGEIISYPFTNSLSRSQLNYEYGTIKNIHYGDIHTKFKTLFDISKETVPFINEDKEIKGWKDDVFCQLGDLVIADASEDYKDVGKAIEIINLNNEKLVAGLHTYIARPNPGIAALGFFGYLFQTDFVRKQIMTMATGISVLGISKTNLQKLTLFLPEVKEQQKIASFLSAIDDKIGHVGQQLEKAKGWKKGLLQGMFV